jgi:hypothetical protein
MLVIALVPLGDTVIVLRHGGLREGRAGGRKFRNRDPCLPSDLALFERIDHHSCLEQGRELHLFASSQGPMPGLRVRNVPKVIDIVSGAYR